MSYLGRQPTIGNFLKLDSITTSATATYNLLNGGVAYSPQSANHCIVSLNGVIQSPNTSFTISGSTIVFASALTATDVIDFILVLGDVLNIGTPSDATVGFSKVTSNLITGATAETSIAGDDSILIYDDSATALRKMTRTNFVAGIGAAAGQVIQVVSTTSNSAQSINSQTFTELTSLTTSITPSSTSNKILIFGNINFTSDTNEALAVVHFRLRRDSTDICQGTGATGNQVNASISALDTDNDAVCGTAPFSFLDSPNTTSAISYKIMGANWTGASGFRINQPVSPGNEFYAGFVTSTLTLMEIKG